MAPKKQPRMEKSSEDKTTSSARHAHAHVVLKARNQECASLLLQLSYLSVRGDLSQAFLNIVLRACSTSIDILRALSELKMGSGVCLCVFYLLFWSLFWRRRRARVHCVGVLSFDIFFVLFFRGACTRRNAGSHCDIGAQLKSGARRWPASFCRRM